MGEGIIRGFLKLLYNLIYIFTAVETKLLHIRFTYTFFHKLVNAFPSAADILH